MAKRFKTRSIKANKSYQVDELADTAGVSIGTVRNWIRAGMPLLDESRPMMIMGFQALEFLMTRQTNGKRPLQVGEFYCLRCKAPRAPMGAMADYVPTSETGGRLKALCGTCECQCNRNIRGIDLPEIRKVLDVETRDGWRP